MAVDIERLRAEICEVGRLLYDRGYVVANDGNISVRMGDRLLVTPSGVGKGRMTPDMLVLCDLQGEPLPCDRSGRHPSSEVKMHCRVYRERPDAGAVVHAHPVHATAYAICRRPLGAAYLPEMVLSFGEIPVADFAMLSTDEVPESIMPYVHDHDGLLLANHGALAWGTDLWAAFDRLETIEHTARIYAQVEALGGGVELDGDQVARLKGLRDFYARRFAARDMDIADADGTSA